MKSYANLEQSKILSKILPHESADMWYWEFPTAPTYNNYGYPMFHKGEGIRNVPCWSLAALLGILHDYTLQTNTDGTVFVVCESKKPMISDAYDNPVDACYEMILKLKELNLFYCDYEKRK